MNWYQRRDECFAVSAEHPFGKFYSAGEIMDEVNVGCNVGCRCTGSHPHMPFALLGDKMNLTVRLGKLFFESSGPAALFPTA